MPNCSVGPSKCEMKFSSKEIWYGLPENAWFPWQPLTLRDNYITGGYVALYECVATLLLGGYFLLFGRAP